VGSTTPTIKRGWPPKTEHCTGGTNVRDERWWIESYMISVQSLRKGSDIHAHLLSVIKSTCRSWKLWPDRKWLIGPKLTLWESYVTLLKNIMAATLVKLIVGTAQNCKHHSIRITSWKDLYWQFLLEWVI